MEKYTKKATGDALIAAAIISIFTGIAIKFDFFDKFYDFTRLIESYQLDEILFFGMPTTIICMIWFIARRRHDSILAISEARERTVHDTTTALLHHLRQPLTYGLICVDFLLRLDEKDPDNRPPDYTRNLECIRKSYERITHTLEELEKQKDIGTTEYMPGVTMIRVNDCPDHDGGSGDEDKPTPGKAIT